MDLKNAKKKFRDDRVIVSHDDFSLILFGYILNSLSQGESQIKEVKELLDRYAGSIDISELEVIKRCIKNYPCGFSSELVRSKWFDLANSIIEKKNNIEQYGIKSGLLRIVDAAASKNLDQH